MKVQQRRSVIFMFELRFQIMVSSGDEIKKGGKKLWKIIIVFENWILCFCRQKLKLQKLNWFTNKPSQFAHFEKHVWRFPCWKPLFWAFCPPLVLAFPPNAHFPPLKSSEYSSPLAIASQCHFMCPWAPPFSKFFLKYFTFSGLHFGSL